MHFMGNTCFSFALVLLLLNSISLSSGRKNFNLITDYDALFAFKNSVTSDPYAILAKNWSTNSSICNWIGVSCGAKHLRVISLNLSNFHIGGIIAPHLGNLTFLRSLDISSNYFTGFIPHELSNLWRLKEINLEHNNLTGYIPYGIFNVSSMRSINLRFNDLSGSLPSDLCDYIPRIELLYLSDNQISGKIPQNIYKCIKLKELRLSYNSFIGELPQELASMPYLEILYLGVNSLHGSIPSSLFNISTLKGIALGKNEFVDKLPNDMCNNMPRLKTLYLETNHLYGQIPPNIYKCHDLEILSLSDNHLNGKIPSEIGNLSMLRELHLRANYFMEGEVPKEFGKLSKLETLNFESASLTGNIPSSIFNISSLIRMSLGINSFTGGIPKHVGRLTSLRVLDLQDNDLTGGIPKELGNLTSLTILYLSNNNLTAMILVIIIIMLIRRQQRSKVPAPTIVPSLDLISWRKISYIELERGTSSFSETNLLGKGRFGSVFRGTLSDGLTVAVKVFNLQLEGVAKSFDTESEILSNIRHRNLVGIIGCCCNMEFKALILAYMSNGSLEKWLHSENYCLDLLQKLEIVIDVVLTLEYLHHGHTFPVVHCDIKPSNILLDEDMIARLSDFGISKLFDEGETVIQTKTMATIGYVAPEYGSEGKVSTNGDVYSYGILLLEMFTSKKPTDDMFGQDMSLKDWVEEALQENAVAEVVAPALLSREDQNQHKIDECVTSIFRLALQCLATSPDERINMVESVAALQKIKSRVVGGTTRNRQTAISIIQDQRTDLKKFGDLNMFWHCSFPYFSACILLCSCKYLL